MNTTARTAYLSVSNKDEITVSHFRGIEPRVCWQQTIPCSFFLIPMACYAKLE